jgi:hypothetical protein
MTNNNQRRQAGKTTISVDKSLREWLRRQADRRGMHVSELSKRLLVAGLKKVEKMADMEID